MRILFDPTPVARLGVNLATEHVFIGSDFSCVAFMIEEYLAHGMTKLVIPKSRPEAALVPNMPLTIQRRVEICDDSESIAAAGRLLFHARKKYNASYDDESGNIIIPKEVPDEEQINLLYAHDIVRRLAFSFKYETSLEMRLEASRANLSNVRRGIDHSGERAVIAEIEGELLQYETVSYQGVRPDRSSPAETLNSIDQIMNDPSYGGYSTGIAHLGPAEHRQRALSDIRRYGQIIRESQLASLGWSILSAVVSACSGAQIPSFQDLKKDFTPRPMPMMLDLRSARQRAIDTWKENPPKEAIIGFNEKFESPNDIAWLDPCPSVTAAKAGSRNSSMGTVGELLKILKEFEKSIKQG